MGCLLNFLFGWIEPLILRFVNDVGNPPPLPNEDEE
jgi:hypothetical protein